MGSRESKLCIGMCAYEKTRNTYIKNKNENDCFNILICCKIRKVFEAHGRDEKTKMRVC